MHDQRTQYYLIRIVVANNGDAIAPSEIDQLFEPLKRGAETEEGYQEENHPGLGLYIVREVVKARGGEIDVCPEQGETAFSIRLPRNRWRSTQPFCKRKDVAYVKNCS